MKNKFVIGWVPPVLWLFGSLAILSAVYRIFITSNALVTGVMPTDPDDLHYVKHALLISLHIVPGLLFLLLGPLQFISSLRALWPKLHRWSGRVFIVSGLITAVTAIVINTVFPPVGGLLKSLAVYIFSVALAISLIVALRAILRRDITRHRAWMIRAFAIGLSISTMRIFFIPAYMLFGIPSNFTIALGMWIGFIVNILVAEIILWRERIKLSALNTRSALALI
jgi:uncharacterized membrane protein